MSFSPTTNANKQVPQSSKIGEPCNLDNPSSPVTPAPKVNQGKSNSINKSNNSESKLKENLKTSSVNGNANSDDKFEVTNQNENIKIYCEHKDLITKLLLTKCKDSNCLSERITDKLKNPNYGLIALFVNIPRKEEINNDNSENPKANESISPTKCEENNCQNHVG